jgi:hypothetical protein
VEHRKYVSTSGVAVGEWVPFESLKPQDKDFIRIITCDCSGHVAYRDAIGVCVFDRVCMFASVYISTYKCN